MLGDFFVMFFSPLIFFFSKPVCYNMYLICSSVAIQMFFFLHTCFFLFIWILIVLNGAAPNLDTINYLNYFFPIFCFVWVESTSYFSSFCNHGNKFDNYILPVAWIKSLVNVMTKKNRMLLDVFWGVNISSHFCSKLFICYLCYSDEHQLCCKLVNVCCPNFFFKFHVFRFNFFKAFFKLIA